MYSFRFQQTQLRPVLTLSIGLVALGLATLLTGCGTGAPTADLAGTQKTIKVSGIVHGGQQPVSQATIQLYSVGTGGLKSASNPLIGSTIQTGSDGSFNILEPTTIAPAQRRCTSWQPAAMPEAEPIAQLPWPRLSDHVPR